MNFDLKLQKFAHDQFDPNNISGTDGLQGLMDPGTMWFIPAVASPAATAMFGGVGGGAVLYAPDGGAGNAAAAGGAGSGGTTSVTSAATTTSPFVINISWDSSVQSAPSGFTTAVIAAAQYLESQFVDPVTVNVSIGYGEVNGTALGSNTLGSSLSYLSSVSYTNLRNALAADATTTTDTTAVASLPSSSPVSGTFWTTTADAKAIGLAAATGTATDGFIGFSSSLPFTYNDSSGVASGTYDFNGVALHEMTEVMGRLLLTGGTIGNTANSYNLMDLFHYSSAGVRDFSASTPGYFSVNSGNSSLGTFNTTSGGDAGDWASSMGYNSFDAFSSSGVINPVTANDLSVIDAIGWNFAGVSAPTGVALAAITSGLASAQTSTGLAAGAALANVTQVGGASGDSYSYALGGSYAPGGTNAGVFALNSANNAATLAVGTSALTGAANGQLYAPSIIATDTTSGNSSQAVPLGVIVGSGGSDTVSIASLTASLGAATPTFIYGLAGSDTINGTGMTGRLWLVGGAGADTMTGGSGVNDYLYGSTGDSTAGAMDIITNFHASADLIDLTGLGQTLKYAGKIKFGKLAAGSVGWQTSGGNTFVYVNTSGSSESLTATNMKMELQGSISLNSGNIIHL
jgi:hypothetical protein